MSDQYVSLYDIYGYQFERNHNSVIKYLVERTDREGVRTRDVFLRNLFEECRGQGIALPKPFSNFEPKGIDRVKAYLEYAFGRSKRIDLVIQVWMKEGPHLDFVIEAKVDGTPDHTQMTKSYEDYSNAMKNEQAAKPEEKYRYERRVIPVLSLFGAASVCSRPQTTDYAVLGPTDWNRIVPMSADVFVQAWKYALERELYMVANVRDAFVHWERDVDPGEIYRYFEHRSHAQWLYVYDEIQRREFAEIGPWAVFSSGNNPILQWSSGPDLKYEDFDLHLYWELNWSALKLKVEFKGEGNRDAAVRSFRAEIDATWKKFNNKQEHGYKIRPTYHKQSKSDYFSLYSFDMGNPDFITKDYLTSVARILSSFHAFLQKEFANGSR